MKLLLPIDLGALGLQIAPHQGLGASGLSSRCDPSFPHEKVFLQIMHVSKERGLSKRLPENFIQCRGIRTAGKVIRFRKAQQWIFLG